MANIPVSLSTFVDFAVASPMSKAGVVQKAKKPIGSQGFDYWLPLREAIIKLHRQNAVPSTLSNVLDDLDKRKLDNYRECITGYKQWLKRKRLKPISGPTALDLV